MRDQGEFVKLLTAHNMRLYAFALSICRNHQDAEDILQQAAAVMWEKRAGFEPGSSFGMWSRAVLYRVAMNHMRARKRHPLLCDVETLEALSSAFENADEIYDNRRLMDALDGCMGRLSPEHRKMIRLRYCENRKSAELGEMFEKTISAVDVVLFRIRRWLERCMKVSLTAEG